MKFLILTQYFAPEIGATQVRLGSVCRELTNAGHEVEVVTAMPHHPSGRIFPEYRGRFYTREYLDGILIHRVWLYAANGSGLRRILNYLSFMTTSLVGLLKARKPDFIFVDSPPLFLGLPGWLAAKLWNCPFIFNVADLWPDSVRDLRIMKDGFVLQIASALEKWIYRRADYVTAVTEGIRETLIRRKHLPTRKVLFLPNGVDTELFQPIEPTEGLRRELGIQEVQVVAVYAGNHGYAAAAEQILEAAKLLPQKLQIHFVFVGDGPEKSKLQKLSGELGLSNITFLPSVPLEKLPAILSIANIALVTLRKAEITRGCRPAKSFVMMAAGKPIVLAAEGEAVELIRRSGSGIVVPPQCPELFAQAILFLSENEDHARQMGEAGREFVKTHFAWNILVMDWLSQLSKASISDAADGTLYDVEKNQASAD